MSPTPLITAPTILDASDIPAYAPHRFGLFSVGDYKGPQDGRWAAGVEFDNTCPTPDRDFPVACAPGSQPSALGLHPSMYSSQQVEARDLVYSAQCYLSGKAENHARAVAEFDYVEQAAIERMYAEMAVTYGHRAGEADNAVDGLSGLLDRWYSRYPAVAPTILITPGLATQLGSRIQRHGNHLELRTGEKVAIATGLLLASSDVRAALSKTNPNNVMLAVGSPFGNRGTRHVFDIDALPVNRTVTIVRATYLPGYLCGIEYVAVDGPTDFVPGPAHLAPGGKAIEPNWDWDPATLNDHVVAEPQTAWAASETATVTGQHGDIDVHWDGTQWQVVVYGAGSTMVYPGLTAQDAPNALKLDANFFSIPATPYGPGTYTEFRATTTDPVLKFYWDGAHWKPGAVPTPPPAIGVTAGTPGAFTPPGSTPPASLAALKADPALGDTGTAKPSAAWTTGQYVVVGGQHVSWNGTAWVAGDAT